MNWLNWKANQFNVLSMAPTSKAKDEKEEDGRKEREGGTKEVERLKEGERWRRRRSVWVPG